MATLEELVVQLTAETSGLKAELAGAAKSSEQAIGKIQSSLDDLSKNSSKNLNFFQASMASLAGFVGGAVVTRAFGLFKEGVGAAIGILQDGAKAAEEEELALQKLANALALAGNYSHQAQTDLEDFTESMEELTGVQDDVVANNLAVLESMTKLNSEGLQKAEKAALGLSAAFGIDLDSAVKLVGKGVEGHTEAFKRYGIQIEGTSDKTQNLANIMKALPFEAATGKMSTFAGASLGVENAFSNLAESMSNAAIKNAVIVASMQEVTKILNGLTAEGKDNALVWRESVAKGVLAAEQALGVTLIVIDNVIRGVTILSNALQLGGTLFTTFGKTVTDVMTGKGFHFFDNFAESVKTDVEDIKSAFNDKTIFGDIAEQVATVSVAGEKAFGDLKNSVMEAIPSVGKYRDEIITLNAAAAKTNDEANRIREVDPEGAKRLDEQANAYHRVAAGLANAASASKELTEAQKAHNETVKSFSTGLADSARQAEATYTFRGEVLKNAMETEAITKEQYFTAAQELQAEQFATEAEMLEEAHAQSLITETEYQDAKTGLAMKQATQAMALEASKTQNEKEQQKVRAENLKSTFGQIATLSSSSNQTLAAIGKAAAITNATIDGYAAVQKALASAPPPFNFALAALVGTATAANVAKIAGVGLASGITEIPRSASGGNNGDNFPAVLKSGERVVDSDTNQDLKAFLANGGSGGRSVTFNINIAAGTGITKEQAEGIVEGINNYVASGGLKLL